MVRKMLVTNDVKNTCKILFRFLGKLVLNGPEFAGLKVRRQNLVYFRTEFHPNRFPSVGGGISLADGRL
jgi:hypothetical protein